MTSKPKVLFITPLLSSFIRNDIEMLTNEYDLRVNKYQWHKKYFVPFYLIHQIFYTLFHIHTTSKIVIQFGGYWSFIPVILGKLFQVKTYIVLHGTDCASIPSLNYGSLRKPILRWVIKQSLCNAFKLLPVSSSLVQTHNTFLGETKESNQGYKTFFMSGTAPHEVIPNGVDECFWKNENVERKNQSFLTISSNTRFTLKGVDLILEIAKNLPHCNFYVAGATMPVNVGVKLKNVLFLGHLSREQLREYYNSVEYYMQLSAYEGFGISLCEAMLCGCIPIGSSVNVIPEIIGDSGFILEKKYANELQKTLQNVINTSDLEKQKLSKLARERVVNKYSFTRRKEALLRVLKEA
ncbi:MAG: glycosyltransferase involved in cell wall biosynthesis [Flavobacteriales bacterium]|jgi:glycosyltransferase involved in cell wall biosynthesis